MLGELYTFDRLHYRCRPGTWSPAPSLPPQVRVVACGGGWALGKLAGALIASLVRSPPTDARSAQPVAASGALAVRSRELVTAVLARGRAGFALLRLLADAEPVHGNLNDGGSGKSATFDTGHPHARGLIAFIVCGAR